ncbi:hypothetical protein KIN20_003923 [Parelaphostrongylus tenuis]|uniref:PDZ domain-containing protein n=1 Tax=Parelaphostrongylus tenuis TaxID=148309 RepID=A0AAD5LZW2_PARTN|nr:hypothetical protein KIN20_003923 [Parelaphostrongylus tenuis]
MDTDGVCICKCIISNAVVRDAAEEDFLTRDLSRRDACVNTKTSLSGEWTQVEVIRLHTEGGGLGFGIVGGASTGVVVKTIIPGSPADKEKNIHLSCDKSVFMQTSGSSEVIIIPENTYILLHMWTVCYAMVRTGASNQVNGEKKLQAIQCRLFATNNFHIYSIRKHRKIRPRENFTWKIYWSLRPSQVHTLQEL